MENNGNERIPLEDENMLKIAHYRSILSEEPLFNFN